MKITIESATKFIILISVKNLNLISIVVNMNYHQLFEISLVLTLIILDGISSLADANHRREIFHNSAFVFQDTCAYVYFVCLPQLSTLFLVEFG